MTSSGTRRTTGSLIIHIAASCDGSANAGPEQSQRRRSTASRRFATENAALATCESSGNASTRGLARTAGPPLDESPDHADHSSRFSVVVDVAGADQAEHDSQKRADPEHQAYQQQHECLRVCAKEVDQRSHPVLMVPRACGRTRRQVAALPNCSVASGLQSAAPARRSCPRCTRAAPRCGRAAPGAPISRPEALGLRATARSEDAGFLAASPPRPRRRASGPIALALRAIPQRACRSSGRPP